MEIATTLTFAQSVSNDILVFGVILLVIGMTVMGLAFLDYKRNVEGVTLCVISGAAGIIALIVCGYAYEVPWPDTITWIKAVLGIISAGFGIIEFCCATDLVLEDENADEYVDDSKKLLP